MERNTAIKNRADIKAEYKWCLQDMYGTDEKWEQAFLEAQAGLSNIAALEKALEPTKQSILKTIDGIFAMDHQVSKLFAYARMRRDEDSRETVPQAMADRAQSLAVQANATAAFLRPALLAMPESLLEDCLKDPAFSEYDRLIKGVLRSRPHTLPAEQEALLAQAEEIGGAPGTIYTLFTEADLAFPAIEGEDGKPVEVSDARLLTLLSSHDGRVRKDAYETVMRTYGQYGNMIAATYAASVKNDVFTARAHKFPSAMEASLFDNEIPVTVYDALLAAVDERLPALNRYQATKRKALGLAELHLWDLYVNTTRDFEMKLSYEEAYDLVLKALEPLGEDYIETLKKARAERWVDVYENQGKHHGAYSWGCYGVHPYVLMNFDGTLDSASTLAHELGHSMHSYYSGKTQPYAKADYTLFAAEVASTVNEVLLSCHLLAEHPERAAQQSLLGTLLEHYRTTVFRQTLFAAFEREAHAMQERGEPLTKEALCELYYGINKKFYGQGCVVDDAVRCEWMRIPHFYRAYYVYQYATGFSAAVCIARKILKEGKPAVEGYRRFLAAGGSLPPLDALRLAGVDMETPRPVREALDWFEEMLMQFEAVC